MIVQYDKLDLHDGDILVIRGNIPLETFRELSKKIKEKFGNVLIINVAGKMTLEKISEKEMNKFGWYRKESR